MNKIVLPQYGSGGNNGNKKIVLPPITSFDSHPAKPDPTKEPIDVSSIQPTAPASNAGSTPAIAPETGNADLLPVIGQGAKSVVTNPVPTLGGVVKGTMDVFFDALKGGASLVGANDFAKYVADNQEATNYIFESNMKTKEAHTAGAVGQFVGQQIPYILGGEAAGIAAAGGKIPFIAKEVSGIVPRALGEYGGGLTLSQVSKVGTLTKVVSNVAGFTAMNQLTLDPETTKSERLIQLRNDLFVLGTLEGLGAGLKIYGDKKLTERARSFYADLESQTPGKVDLNKIAAEANSLKAQIEMKTGDTPEKLLQTHMPELLEAPKDSGVVQGEGFVMADKVNKAQLERGRALNAYRDALAKYTSDPTETNKERVLKARDVRNRAFAQAADTESQAEAAAKKAVASGESASVPAPAKDVSVPDSTVPAPVNNSPVVQPIVKVPGSQLPVGTGQLRTSGLEARVKNALESLTPEERAGISTYSQMNKSAQIAKAVEWVSKNPEDAIRVLKGEIPPPKGILGNSVFVALEQMANNDADLALKLTSLRSTRFGQELSILTERDPLSTVKYMSDLESAKIEAYGSREKFNVIKDTEMAKVKKAISKSNLSIKDWDSFVDSITC